MTFQLRPYQTNTKTDIYNAWAAGHSNVLSVLPTGAGKTVTFSDIIREHTGAAVAIAHRQELVSQISLALARDKIRHRIIGPKNVVKLCVNLHMLELGASYYDPSARCGVAGVDTLVRRGDDLRAWLKSVTLWVQDEAHHVLKDNKWGTAAKMFPNAKGLGVTATPLRADGRGLGGHSDGLFNILTEGPGMRDLINMGYLTDYRIFAPESFLIMDDDDISANTGDFKHTAIVKKFRQAKNKIIGDVVDQYIKHANGKLGITFVPDVEDAIDTATAYTARGIPAAVVSAKTSDMDRIAILRRFRNRELLQLVNVDLFGEGFDLPAIEVVSMARPTQSYALFVQQFGRALRLMVDVANWDSYTNEERRAFIAQSKKPHAIIIDHVGNVARHGLPDAIKSWSLDARDKRRGSVRDDVIPTRNCLNKSCLALYERVHPKCPYCGHFPPPPLARSGPEHVDGDLIELDAATLAAMRGDIERVDMTRQEYALDLISRKVPPIGHNPQIKKHMERQEAITALRVSIQWWGAWQRSAGREDSESYKRFYFKYGIDVGTAQTLKTAEALALAEKINYHLGGLANG